MRTAVKAVIPHVDDHVSKLQSLGVMTQNKLADIGAAAAAAGITYELNVPKNCVGTGMPCYNFVITWQSYSYIQMSSSNHAMNIHAIRQTFVLLKSGS